MNSDPFLCTKLFQKRGHYSRVFKKIRFYENELFKDLDIFLGKVIGMPKLKGETAGPSFDPLQNEQIRPDAPSSKPVLPKNETPNRFWAFVEPYCAPIAQDDIKLLEDLIKGHSDMTEYYKVGWTRANIFSKFD